VVGGIAGALLGSQVGGGNGKVAAAAAGAIAGAMVGDHVDNDGRNYAPACRNRPCASAAPWKPSSRAPTATT
jgi:uncharacterized protein YcfJ